MSKEEIHQVDEIAAFAVDNSLILLHTIPAECTSARFAVAAHLEPEIWLVDEVAGCQSAAQQKSVWER
jgi:ABC-type polysaccharide/polyol phosphate transport system ATPase subunit